MKNKMIDVVVTKKKMESGRIASFELMHPGGEDLPAFSAGSHIDVQIREGLIRQYSLYNSPLERHRYLVAVLCDEAGRGGSKAMHGLIQEQDIISISAPRNSFPLVEDAPNSLLLAGGIGVTPILSMAQRLTLLGSKFDMHYCARSRSETAFFKFLSQSQFSERIHFHFDDGPKEQLLDIPMLVQHRSVGTHIYVCGPSGFMDVVIANTEKDWPDEAVHLERFSSDLQVDNSGNTSFKVKIESSGLIIDVSSDQSITEALLEHGIRVPISCEQGICGTCLTTVLQGEPEHRDNFLTSEEKEENSMMNICCSRSKSDILVLDL
jgi:vanillate O-demethylase ferredoxin subunit